MIRIIFNLCIFYRGGGNSPSSSLLASLAYKLRGDNEVGGFPAKVHI